MRDCSIQSKRKRLYLRVVYLRVVYLRVVERRPIEEVRISNSDFDIETALTHWPALQRLTMPVQGYSRAEGLKTPVKSYCPDMEYISLTGADGDLCSLALLVEGIPRVDFVIDMDTFDQSPWSLEEYLRGV